ncbi:ABC transporter ATP-binding protein [Streptomyces sp. NPDC050610]|uniref:ABC transporter ATP-binding protein n=1 Tax=Streptomyces sp. NPDC050610 TaxID=3157097 RepID=UPI00343C8094
MTDLTYQPDRTAVEAVGLGYKHWRGRALRDCSFRLPSGRVCGLVGPNGAGKSTLLALAAGLRRPTEGRIELLGHEPADPALRPRIGYLAQDKPLYPYLTVRETLRLGRELNPDRWDQATAESILGEGHVPFGRRVAALSGGQRTRVALALVFAKRPEILLLDEPLSDLDPLVQHEMTAALMSAAAEHAITVVMSSHVLASLDGVCDYLLLIAGGRVRLAGEVEDLLAAHSLVVGRKEGGARQPELAPHTVIESRTTGRQLTALVRSEGPVTGPWEAAEPSLEELLLGYLRSPDAPCLFTPSAEPRTRKAAA